MAQRILPDTDKITFASMLLKIMPQSGGVHFKCQTKSRQLGLNLKQRLEENLYVKTIIKEHVIYYINEDKRLLSMPTYLSFGMLLYL